MTTRALKRQAIWMATLLAVAPWIGAAAKPTAKPGTPTKPPAQAPAADASNEQEEPKIPGVTIPRTNGGFLGLSLEAGHFKLQFYDDHKKPMAPDVPRASARWNPKQKVGEEFAVMNPAADGQALVGNKFVQGPFPIRVNLTLLNNDGVATEHYWTNFHP